MDLNGTWASLGFSSFNFGFAGSRFTKLANRSVGYASLQAYNDWMIDEWCAAAPERYIPCQMSWLGDPELAAKEIRRNAARGFHAVSFSENPEGQGFPSVYGDHWDPFFAACAETETVINLHVGSSGSVHTPSVHAPADAKLALVPRARDQRGRGLDLRQGPDALSGYQDRGLSEGGVSWVPMVIERLRRTYRACEAGNAWLRSDGDPVEILHRNFWFTSVEDPSAFQLLSIVGEDKVMVEVDYPHVDSTWPDTQALLESELQHLTPASIRKICYENAAGLYQHPEPPRSMIEASVMGSQLLEGVA